MAAVNEVAGQPYGDLPYRRGAPLDVSWLDGDDLVPYRRPHAHTESDTDEGLAAALRDSSRVSSDSDEYEDVLANSLLDTGNAYEPMPFTLELFLSWRMLCVCRIPGNGNCWFLAVVYSATEMGIYDRFLNACGCTPSALIADLRQGFAAFIASNYRDELDAPTTLASDHWLYPVWSDIHYEMTSESLDAYLSEYVRKDMKDTSFCLFCILAVVLEVNVIVYYVLYRDNMQDIKRWACNVYTPQQSVRAFSADEMHLWPTTGFIMRYDGKHYDSIVPCHTRELQRAPGVFYGNSALNTVLMYFWIRAIAERRSGFFLYDTHKMPWQAKRERDSMNISAKVVRRQDYAYHVSHYDQVNPVGDTDTVLDVDHFNGFRCCAASLGRGVGDECLYCGDNVWGIQKSVDVCIFEDLCALMGISYGFTSD